MPKCTIWRLAIAGFELPTFYLWVKQSSASPHMIVFHNDVNYHVKSVPTQCAVIILLFFFFFLVWKLFRVSRETVKVLQEMEPAYQMRMKYKLGKLIIYLYYQWVTTEQCKHNEILMCLMHKLAGWVNLTSIKFSLHALVYCLARTVFLRLCDHSFCT